MQNFFSFGMNQPISNPLGLNQGVISFNNSPFELMPQPFMIPPIRTVQYVIIRRE